LTLAPFFDVRTLTKRAATIQARAIHRMRRVPRPSPGRA